MLQLPEVHPQTVRPTKRPPRAQDTDAKSQCTRDNAIRLRHVESVRVPLRHAAPRALHIVLLTRFIGWRKKTRTSSYTPNFSPVHLVCINRLAQQRLAPALAVTSSRITMHTPIKRALAGLLTIVD